VILLQHGAGSRKEDLYISGPAARWARDGYATVAIDAHRHGERATGEEAARAIWAGPWQRRDHAVQMAVDLMRTLDYLAERPDIDLGRVGFAGFSMGTIMGVLFVGLDERVRAAVFCIGGAGLFGPAAGGAALEADRRLVSEIVDPAHFAPLIAPRPTLMINGRRDETVPPAAGQRLFDALGEPKQIIWFEGGHTDLTGDHFKQMWAFFREHV